MICPFSRPYLSDCISLSPARLWPHCPCCCPHTRQAPSLGNLVLAASLPVISPKISMTYPLLPSSHHSKASYQSGPPWPLPIQNSPAHPHSVPSPGFVFPRLPWCMLCVLFTEQHHHLLGRKALRAGATAVSFAALFPTPGL